MDHIIYIGRPGSGKTLRARELATDPSPEAREKAVLTDANRRRIYRLAGLDSNDLPTAVPFRSPHHTVSLKGMMGDLVGGFFPRPGEFSLAHGGVLFLDDVQNFRKEVLDEVLRALKEKSVTLRSPSSQVTLPADFRLVLGAFPSPCGYPQGSAQCKCSDEACKRWMSRLVPFQFYAKTIVLD